MTDTPSPFDFGSPASPGDRWPAVMGAAGEEEAPSDLHSGGVDRSEIPRPRAPEFDLWIPPGLWTGVWPQLTAQNMSDSNANTLYAWAFPTTTGGFIKQVGNKMATAAPATSKMRIGIYAATSITNLYPGKRLWQSPEIDLTVTTVTKTIVGLALPPQRVYWLVFDKNTAASSGTYAGVAGASIDTPLGYPDVDTGFSARRAITVAWTFASLPDIFPPGLAGSQGSTTTVSPPALIQFEGRQT